MRMNDNIHADFVSRNFYSVSETGRFLRQALLPYPSPFRRSVAPAALDKR